MLNELEIARTGWFSDPPKWTNSKFPLLLWPWTASHGDPEQLLISTAGHQERAVNGGRQSVKWFDSRL